ncbi:carboxypeptidase-like regulatory domain-containing protein [Tunturibacter empetritectus]|uniref:carboxypeptidase-like regulatory domain-containing protein n=1 Tax=Tunturiibacter empetritectus TaxID=3069691 RepID=UPI003872C20E
MISRLAQPRCLLCTIIRTFHPVTRGVFCKPESSARCYFYLSSIRCSDRTPAAVCGFVQDASRVRIAAAKVEAQLAGTAQTRRVSSDSRGEFSIEELTPGSWHVPSMRLASQLLGRIYP